MRHLYDTKNKEVYSNFHDWRELIAYARAISKDWTVIVKKVSYSDGCRIVHVYCNIYVAFSCDDHQDAVVIVDLKKDPNAWAELDLYTTYPPESEHNLEKFEFSNGWSASWKEINV